MLSYLNSRIPLSSVSSRNYKYRRPNNPSQGSESIAGPSHPRDSRQGKPPTEGSRHEGSEQYDKARETRTNKNGTIRAAERRPVRSKQATAVRPCPYYLRSRGLHRHVDASRFNEPDGRQGCVLARTVESNQGGRFDSNESVADSFPSGAVGFKSSCMTILGAFSSYVCQKKPPVGKRTRCPRSPLRRSSPLR
ncbi:uncharacterized protein TNCV_4296791 [Trichonephila clavipes]|nr:uncharacterized protein TNCV_4296791 [Trichonephila clavipes]